MLSHSLLIATLALLASALEPPSTNPQGSAETAPRPAAVEVAASVELPAAYELIEVEGFRGRVRAEWMRDRPMEVRRVLAALKTDIGVIDAVVPQPAMRLLRERVTIWISPSLAPRMGFSGRGMCFHESEEWLDQNALGRERVRGVEICNAEDYLIWRAEQPMMMLHELAHAYHEAMRPNDEAVVTAYEAARQSGRYERVRYVMTSPDAPKRAYAISNNREYFAELSEAYFGRNDYGPMTRDELRAFDPAGYAMVEGAWSNPPASSQPAPSPSVGSPSP